MALQTRGEAPSVPLSTLRTSIEDELLPIWQTARALRVLGDLASGDGRIDQGYARTLSMVASDDLDVLLKILAEHVERAHESLLALCNSECPDA